MASSPPALKSFIAALSDLNAEADWQREDLESPEAGVAVFQRYAKRLLKSVGESYVGVDLACLAVVGLRCSYLVPVATRPVELLPAAKEISRADADALRELSQNALVENVGALNVHALPKEVRESVRDQLIVQLISYGEYFGLLWLYSATENYFDGEVLTEIAEAVPTLSRNISEAIFSLRLQALAAPFQFRTSGRPSEQELYDQITKLATMGMAADGAVLRLHDSQSDQLLWRAESGDVRHGPAESGSAGERISRMVFDSSKHWGTARTVATGKYFGVEITEDDERMLRAAGIGAYIVVRLQSEIGTSATGAQGATGAEAVSLGTLAIFHYRAHEFSLRDVHLFRCFCERAADDLALLRQAQQLDEANENMRMQFNMLTRAEIIALLAHDLGHKAIAATEEAKRFTKTCMKAVRESRKPDYVEAESRPLIAACQAMEWELGKVRNISNKVDEKPVRFEVKKAVEEVRDTLRSALERNSMTMHIVVAGTSPECFGPKGIFQQAIFNLVINSIDAQKESGTGPNTINIHLREERQGDLIKAIIRFWDEGPGISARLWPDPAEIFLIGKTSKPKEKGSGTGLPISRSLLNNFFRADLELRERKGAHFEIRIPVKFPKAKLP